MALEGTSGSKFAQLVTYHVFRNVYGNMLSAIVDRKGVADEFGENGGGARPGLHNSLFTLRIHIVYLFHQRRFDVRSFFNTSSHLSHLHYFAFLRFTMNLLDLFFFLRVL